MAIFCNKSCKQKIDKRGYICEHCMNSVCGSAQDILNMFCSKMVQL